MGFPLGMQSLVSILILFILQSFSLKTLITAFCTIMSCTGEDEIVVAVHCGLPLTK
jgi:hypothetical protein